MSTREDFERDHVTGERFTGTATPGYNGGLRYGQSRLDRSDGMTVVSGKCFVTGMEHAVIVPTAGLDAWIGGHTLAQLAMPTVEKEDREFLISGTSPDGWAQTFADGED